jgi:hypothetical protein
MCASRFVVHIHRLGLVLGVLVIGADGALAQYGAKKQPQLPPGRISGEVKGTRSGALLVSDGNQAYWVQVAPGAQKVDVVGEGDLSLLQAGMFVRFDIKMDKQGNGKEDVTKIELFTPDPQVARTGIESKGDDSYTVAGQLKSITKVGKMTVQAPGDKPTDRVTIKAQVAKDATLDVGVRGGPWLKLAKAGDSATVAGRVAKPSQPNSPGAMIADEIQVKLVKPLAVEFGKEKPEPKSKTPEKKAAKAKE